MKAPATGESRRPRARAAEVAQTHASGQSRGRKRDGENGKTPRVARSSVSRPVSRIPSGVTIHLCSYPAPPRAASTEPVRLAPDGVWRAAASPRSLVGSYPTVSPLPASPPELRRRRSVFCATFRRLSPPPSRERPALWCPDFPRRQNRRRSHPACTGIVALASCSITRSSGPARRVARSLRG